MSRENENTDIVSKKGKTTKPATIRIDLLVPRQMDENIIEISEAMKIEKATMVRLLIWFGIRFASPIELTGMTNERSFDAETQSTQRLDTRIPQDMLESIESLMKIEGVKKSRVIKRYIEWALENIHKYTFADFLNK